MLALTNPDNQAGAVGCELCHLLKYVITCSSPAFRHCAWSQILSLAREFSLFVHAALRDVQELVLAEQVRCKSGLVLGNGTTPERTDQGYNLAANAPNAVDPEGRT